MLTDKQEQAYLDKGGSRCLVCSSVDIEARQTDADGSQIFQQVICNDCDSEWTEYYKLSGVSDLIKG